MNTSSPVHPVACFGEILWDLLPSGDMPGGAPMNAAYHLFRLGMNPAMISRTGADARGKALLDYLHGKGVGTEYIQTDESVPTGIVHAKPNADGDMQYDIVAPAAWDHIQVDPSLETLVHGADYFIFGSLGARHPVSRNTLFSLLRKAQTRVLDINLRPPHFDRALLEELMQHADILKLNMHELEFLSDWLPGNNTPEEAMAALQDRYQLRTVLVTNGSHGAMLRMEGEHFSHPGYQVKVADTVGSGDAFLAGAVFQLMQKAAPGEVLEFANRLAATVTGHKGAMPDYEMQELYALQ